MPKMTILALFWPLLALFWAKYEFYQIFAKTRIFIIKKLKKKKKKKKKKLKKKKN